MGSDKGRGAGGVAGNLDRIPELIESGEKLTFENFSHKSERGLPSCRPAGVCSKQHEYAFRRSQRRYNRR